jgi:hypothetical protein
MQDDERDGTRLRDRLLRGLFALALAWTLLSSGIWILGEQFGVPNPAPEGTWLHIAIEDALPPLVAIGLAGVITTLVIRFLPGFLHFPQQVTSSRILLAFTLAAPLVALFLLISVSTLFVALEPPPWRSDNPQYFPAVFWYAPLLTTALTPVGTVIAAWWWVLRREKRRLE